jgi:hypothetical protein
MPYIFWYAAITETAQEEERGKSPVKKSTQAQTTHRIRARFAEILRTVRHLFPENVRVRFGAKQGFGNDYTLRESAPGRFGACEKS